MAGSPFVSVGDIMQQRDVVSKNAINGTSKYLTGETTAVETKASPENFSDKFFCFVGWLSGTCPCTVQLGRSGTRVVPIWVD